MRELKANDMQKISGGEFTAEHGIAGGINGGLLGSGGMGAGIGFISGLVSYALR